MTRRRKILLAIGLAVAAIGLTALSITLLIRAPRLLFPPVTLSGDVLRQDSDPAKETPISGVSVSAVGSTVARARSDPSGFFTVTLNSGVRKGESVLLTFNHPDYKTLEIVAKRPGDQLYIARMQPAQPEAEAPSRSAEAHARIVEIGNVRVRYSFKEESTVNVGSLAKQFTAKNVGNVPCRRQPCSPDGTWAATRTDLPLNAQEGNDFRNVRILCVAGPCAFTRVVSQNFARPARAITASVLNWSDPAVFVVEADVIRPMVTDAVQYAYPFVVGTTMNFALPTGSEGPSIEADIDGQFIVFPLGPANHLPWAACTVEVSQQSKIFRCDLNPGYRFRE